MLILAFDVVNQTLVSGYNGSASALGPIRQGKFDARIYLVEPNPDFITGQPVIEQYSAFDVSSYAGIRLGIWDNSTGTLNDSGANVLALTAQENWTYVTTAPLLPYFSGTVNTLTEEMEAHIGSSNSKAAYFAINLVRDTDLFPVFDHRSTSNIIVYSATDDGGGVLPIVITGAAARIPLPMQFGPDADGLVWVLSTWLEAGVPAWSFACINPPA